MHLFHLWQFEESRKSFLRCVTTPFPDIPCCIWTWWALHIMFVKYYLFACSQLMICTLSIHTYCSDAGVRSLDLQTSSWQFSLQCFVWRTSLTWLQNYTITMCTVLLFNSLSHLLFPLHHCQTGGYCSASGAKLARKTKPRDKVGSSSGRNCCAQVWIATEQSGGLLCNRRGLQAAGRKRVHVPPCSSRLMHWVRSS